MKKMLIVVLAALSLFALVACSGSSFYETVCARCGRKIQVSSKPKPEYTYYCVDCMEIINNQ